MREEPARPKFSRGFRPRVARAALPQVRDTFFFSSSFEWGFGACRGRNRVRSGEGPGAYGPTAGVRRAPPGDPASAPLGTPELMHLPGGGGGEGRPCPGSAGGASQPPPGPRSPEAQLPAAPSGPWARGRLHGSPCRSALSPPCTRRLRTSPPTCSLLLTSRAAGTMGWGCHSNQTGRHNPGMCAAPPAVQPCRRRCRRHPRRAADSGCGARWAERPGLCGSGAKAAQRKGSRRGGGGFGGWGGRRPPSSRRGRLARRAHQSGSARVKAGTAPGGRGGAHLPSPPRRACGARWAPRRSCRGCSRTRWRTRTKCQVSGASTAPGARAAGGAGGRPGPRARPRGRRGLRAGGGARAAGCAPALLAPRGQGRGAGRTQGRGARAAKGGVQSGPPGPRWRRTSGRG